MYVYQEINKKNSLQHWHILNKKLLVKNTDMLVMHAPLREAFYLLTNFTVVRVKNLISNRSFAKRGLI